jgi:RHS repeat-associated protein
LSNKYLYYNKELQDDELAGNSLGWYDYEARMYDALLGRWHNVDPLAENYYPITPYAYFANNPLSSG